MGVAAGVITVALAVGIEFPAGVGDHGPAAAAAEREALEQVKMLVAAPEPPRCRRQRRADRGVGPLPQVVRDEGRMLPGKFLAVHADTAGVERAGDQPAHDVGAESFFANVLFLAAAAIEDPGPRAQAFGVEGVCDLRERSEARRQFEDAPQRGSFGGMRAQALERFIVDVTKRNLPAGPEPAFGLFVEFDPDFLSGVQPLVFRDAHEQVVL